MPVKNLVISLLIVSAFWWMNTATSKNLYFPCNYQIISYLGKDTLQNIYMLAYSHDTIVLRADKDTLLSDKTERVCSILKDSCQIKNYKILVVDSSNDQSTWNTPFGKKLFFRQCP